MMDWLRTMLVQTRSDRTMPSRALLIPCSLPGSVGDAAMMSAAVSQIRARTGARIDLLSKSSSELDPRVDGKIDGDPYFYGGSETARREIFRDLGGYQAAYFIGADVIDGKYNPNSVNARLGVLAAVAQHGGKATVLGASYNLAPEASTAETLRTLPDSVTICARDPLSRERMEARLQRPIRQVADLAFLCAPRPNTAFARRGLDFIRRHKAAGTPVVGVNANSLHALENEHMVAATRALIAGLLAEGAAVMLVPHDSRTKRSDRRLLEQAAADIGRSDRARLFTLPIGSPGATRAVLSELDFIVTGRMHAAILAMAGSTPAFGFAYQHKFEGLYALFGLDSAKFSQAPAEFIAAPERTVRIVMSLLNDRTNLANTITTALPRITGLALENFA